jgi:hypothetical protein
MWLSVLTRAYTHALCVCILACFLLWSCPSYHTGPSSLPWSATTVCVCGVCMCVFMCVQARVCVCVVMMTSPQPGLGERLHTHTQHIHTHMQTPRETRTRALPALHACVCMCVCVCVSRCRFLSPCGCTARTMPTTGLRCKKTIEILLHFFLSPFFSCF